MNKESRNIVPKGASRRELAAESPQNIPEIAKSIVIFELFGEEIIEKTVKLDGNCGRIYLPLRWEDHHVKVIRVD